MKARPVNMQIAQFFGIFNRKSFPPTARPIDTKKMDWNRKYGPRKGIGLTSNSRLNAWWHFFTVDYLGPLRSGFLHKLHKPP